jgi:cysteinyl-tRNA synthetase
MATAYRRIEGFVGRARELLGDIADEPVPLVLASLPAAFVDAMNDDIGVPQALAVLHNTVREGNAALADADKDRVADRLRSVTAMLGVLGLDDAPVRADEAAGARAVIDSLVALALQQRTAARERKDYDAADAIRDQLAQAGIIVEDTAAGARWQLRRD